MSFRILLLLLFILNFKSKAAYQDSLLHSFFEQLEIENEDIDLEELSERLELLRKKPLNINKASKEDLQQLVFLSPLHINNLLKHRELNGDFSSLYEVQTVEGFDPKTTAFLLSFLKIDDALSDVSVNTVADKHKIYLRYGQVLEKQAGYSTIATNPYLGPPSKLLLKYSLQAKDIFSLNLTLEKDAGEPYLAKGIFPDFSSFNLRLHKLWKLSNLIVGDYNLQFGQGLTLWSGFSLGKGLDVVGLTKNEVGARPYSSSNESNFFRGLTFKLRLSSQLNLTPFLSFRKLDAKLQYHSNNDSYITSINSSGLHRTSSEMASKNTVSSDSYGASLQFSHNAIQIRATVYNSVFDTPFEAGDQPYQKFNFSGKSLVNSGLAYNYTFKNIYLFGEVSKSYPGEMGFLNGLLVNLSPSISASLLHRKYPVKFYNSFSNAIGENTINQNEEGLLMALNIQFTKNLKFSFYRDEFAFPWLKFRVHKPERGSEFRAQLDYNPNKTSKFSVRYKSTHKPINNDLGQGVPEIQNNINENIRIQGSWNLTSKISTQSGAQYTLFKNSTQKENGFALYQDFKFLASNKIATNFRISYFNTTFNSRVYLYEQDVLHAGGFTMYNGKGLRFYANVKVQLSKGLIIWSRISVFNYPDENSVGSGLDAIAGNAKKDIKLQIAYSF